MKKYTLLVLFLICSSAVFAKENKLQVKAKYYAEAVAQEYKLSDLEKAKILEERTAMMKEVQEVLKKVKVGQLTQEQGRAEIKILNNKVTETVASMTGKTQKELRPFLNKTFKEMKAL